MSEAQLWSKLQTRLRARFLIQRIENMVGSGVPDVHLMRRDDGSQHWIELKYTHQAPARAGTRVFGDRGLRPEQVAWLYARRMGSVWVWAQVGREHVLIHGVWAREFNAMPMARLREIAAAHSNRDITSNITSAVEAILSDGADRVFGQFGPSG